MINLNLYNESILVMPDPSGLLQKNVRRETDIADVKKIKIDGTTYDIRDATAAIQKNNYFLNLA